MNDYSVHYGSIPRSSYRNSNSYGSSSNNWSTSSGAYGKFASSYTPDRNRIPDHYGKSYSTIPEPKNLDLGQRYDTLPKSRSPSVGRISGSVVREYDERSYSKDPTYERKTSPYSDSKYLSSTPSRFERYPQSKTSYSPSFLGRTDREIEIRGPKAGRIGLKNLGNTCYFSTAVQCLSHTKPFREALLESQDVSNSSSMKGGLVTALKSLMEELWRDRSSSEHIDPRRFLDKVVEFAPMFAGFRQQDAQEMLMFILAGLSEETNRSSGASNRPPTATLAKSRRPSLVSWLPDPDSPRQETPESAWRRFKSLEDSFITDLMAGQLSSTLTCLACHHQSITYDPFFQLSVPIPSKSYGSVTLEDCLALFCTEETLDDNNNAPTCEKCKKSVGCSKQLKLERIPRILVIHLVRFTQGFTRKVKTKVESPLEDLHLSRYASNSRGGGSSYKLYATIDHAGTCTSGHYMAKCLISDSTARETWHCFNDTVVSEIQPSKVISESNYVLFYRREDTNPSIRY